MPWVGWDPITRLHLHSRVQYLNSFRTLVEVGHRFIYGGGNRRRVTIMHRAVSMRVVFQLVHMVMR
jgi:hypothetical protein